MGANEQRAWQQAAYYQANVSYLVGILNLITEATRAYSGRELKERIVALAEKGKKHSRIYKEAQ